MLIQYYKEGIQSESFGNEIDLIDYNMFKKEKFKHI